MRREIRPGGGALRRLAMACALAALGNWGIPQGLAQAGPEEEGGGDLATVDHHVAHISTMPANPGEAVELFVRERYAGRRPIGKPVVMVHGRSVPAVAGFALQ